MEDNKETGSGIIKCDLYKLNSHISEYSPNGESRKEYVGVTEIPKFVHLGMCRIQLRDIKYYILTQSELRVHLYSMEANNFIIINDRDKEALTSMVTKLDELLGVVKL
jgi:hypothetical protein